MGIIIDIVDADTWKGIYFNDELVSQGHNLDLWDVLNLLEDEVVECRRYIHADMDWLDSVSHLPNRLEDVVRQPHPDDDDDDDDEIT
jgi:hypothetical protein